MKDIMAIFSASYFFSLGLSSFLFCSSIFLSDGSWGNGSWGVGSWDDDSWDENEMDEVVRTLDPDMLHVYELRRHDMVSI